MVQPNRASPCRERFDTNLIIRIIRGRGQEHPDMAHPRRLLRPRGERPRTRRPTEHLPPSHAGPRSPSSVEHRWFSCQPMPYFNGCPQSLAVILQGMRPLSATEKEPL
jgi:hypothetical protein